MARYKDTWLAHQRKRWMRPDAYRWFAPKHANFLPPHERKAGFNPDQPRDELGQWTETGAEDEAEDNEFGGELLDEFGGVRKKGHHWVPWEIFRDLDLRPETRRVFINATTGPLAGQRHGNSKEHIIYSRAVGEHLNEFMRREGVEPSNMAPDQARKFVDQVKASGDPRIRDFNLRIYQREINHILRLRGRRPE
jgi:hypothetical protein